MGVLLAQHRGFTCQSFYRPSHRSHNHHAKLWHQRLSSTRFVHQGGGRVDVHVLTLRLCGPARIRASECAVEEEVQGGGQEQASFGVATATQSGLSQLNTEHLSTLPSMPAHHQTTATRESRAPIHQPLRTAEQYATLRRFEAAFIVKPCREPR